MQGVVTFSFFDSQIQFHAPSPNPLSKVIDDAPNIQIRSFGSGGR
jgi:hypothetical protein